MPIVTLIRLTLLCISICVADHVLKQGIIQNDDTWFQTPLLDSPALKYELDIQITFAIEKCCPIMYLPNTLPVRYHFSDIKCYTDVITEDLQHWYRHHAFVFPRVNENFGNCKKDEKNGVYTCHVNTYDMNVFPSKRWLTFGYLCSKKMSLYGLKYSYSVTVEHTTQCEPLNLKEHKIPYLNCEKYYNYMSLPNIYGDRTLSEAIRSIQLLFNRLKSMKTPCHKYLDYGICQAFLPRCPIDKADVDNSLQNETLTVTHIVPLCQEMCWDIWHSCQVELDPIMKYVNCFYYKPRENDSSCIYKDVYCDPPNVIENGKLKEKPKEKYPVHTQVQYVCNEDFELTGNQTSVCGFSGTWSSIPNCKSVLVKKIIIITVPLVVFLMVILILILMCYLRHNKMQNSKKYFESQPLEKRNRDFDAFLSYVSDVHKVHPDRHFAWDILKNKLEKETSPPLKLLIHERNFIAGRPIYQNIVNAVKNSNCAIDIFSQDYIDASWCREEFTVILFVFLKLRTVQICSKRPAGKLTKFKFIGKVPKCKKSNIAMTLGCLFTGFFLRFIGIYRRESAGPSIQSVCHPHAAPRDYEALHRLHAQIPED